MTSMSYDPAIVTAGTLIPQNAGHIIPLNAANACARDGITQPVNVSPDATFMYQYVTPPLSSSSSPYTTTIRDRATESTTLPALPFLNYTTNACQLPYYCPQYLQYPLAEAYQQQALDASGTYHFSSPSAPPVPQDAPTDDRRFTSAATTGAAVTSTSTTNSNIQKRWLSSPLVQEKCQQQVQVQQVGVEMAPTAASAPPVYGVVDSLPQGCCLDADSGVNCGVYNSLLAANQDQQQQQQQYYTATGASCYPVDLQLYATPQLASDAYWAARQSLAWYSRGHPQPSQPAQSREEQQSAPALQDCYYSDLAAALHNMRLWGSVGGGNGGGSGVPSEHGAYSPIQYANWAYSTASPSSQTSSSPFPALYGAHQQQQYHQRSRQGNHQQQHLPDTAGATIVAPRLHQTEFDPEELARLCPGINPPELDPSLVRRTRYFVIKSNSTRHIMLSVHHGVWCSTMAGNDCLNRAYLSMQHIPNAPSTSSTSSTSQFSGRFTDGTAANAAPPIPPGRVLLFFSVNTSGCFCGVAEMISPVDKMRQLDIWQDSRWRGAFKLRWIYAKNVPNRLLRHIQVESAENRAVTHLRDTNEILPASKGEEMLRIIHNN